MIRFFVNRSMAVFSFAVLIILIGAMSYSRLPRESSPEIKQPWIFITTTYIGVSASDIESLITRKIEQEVDGLEGIDEITSSSQQSLSFIFVKFESKVEVETALRRVKDRVDIAKAELPDEADEPIIQELSSSNFPIMLITISHPDGIELINNAVLKVRDELKRIPGVLDIDVAGDLDREIAIEVDPLKLEKYGFALSDVETAVRNENMAIPGGVLKSPALNYALSVTGEIKDPEIFGDITVKSNGLKIPLREIASVSYGWAAPETYSRINGKPCITLSVKKKTGENLVAIADKIKDKLAHQFMGILPQGSLVDYAYDDSRYIKMMVADLENNMITGLILVLMVTIFFLGRVNSLFVSMAIPFSMLMSFFILELCGVTLNMVVLFSLILALGMLVDNGIVIVENIFRHVSMGKDRVEAAIEGSHEVAAPIAASTITTVLAFFPLIFMPGVMGDFMKYLPITVIVVLSSSLFVAIVMNPVFCARFMNISEKNRKKIIEGSGKFAWIQKEYGKVLTWAVAHKARTLGLSFGIVFLGFILYGAFGKEAVFFPSLDPVSAEITVEGQQGLPLKKTNQILHRMEGIIEQVESSKDSVQVTAGQGSSGNIFGQGASQYNMGNIVVEFKPYLERKILAKTTIDEYKRVFKDFTGAQVKVATQEMSPPTGNDVSFQVVGTDYVVIGQIATQIRDILALYPEFKMVDSDFQAAKPELVVDINRQKAAFYGLSTIEIASTIRNAINGNTIGKFRVGEDEYNINLRYEDRFRNSKNMLYNLQIVDKDGNRIPVSSLVRRDIEDSASVGVIRKRNLDRAVTVWADFRDSIQSKEKIKKEINEKVKNLPGIPAGYTVEQGSGLEMRQESTDFLGTAFLIALFLIFIVLIIQFNSLAESFIILISVFLSLGGVFWGYFIFQMNFVIIMSGIGCIALAGVAVNNCIVLVDYTNILIRRERKPWQEAIIEAGKTRLRPVLLTAITTVLGLLPMAFGISLDFHEFTLQVGSESSQMWKAFAWAMIYGLSFATIMTLVIVPTLLAVKFRFIPPKVKPLTP